MEETLRKSLDKFGSHFIVASMVPSLALIAISLIIFDPIVPILSRLTGDGTGVFQIFGISLILIIPTIIIGFSLSALNTYIFKILEGYSVFWRFSPLVRYQQKKAVRLLSQLDLLARRIKRLEKRKKSRRAKNDLSSLKDEYYSLAAKYDQSFPPSIENILPTNIGNTLRASEAYSSTRYGIDSVSFWPRIIQVVPDRYQNYIDQSRNEVSFLINCSILLVILGISSLVAYAIQLFSPTPNLFIDQLLIKSPKAYLFIFIAAIVLAFFFHKAANIVVTNFGDMIRSTFDLFRLDLLEHLKIELPEDSYDEFFLWKKIGEFVVLGPKSLDFDILKYKIND